MLDLEHFYELLVAAALDVYAADGSSSSSSTSSTGQHSYAADSVGR